MKFRLFAPLLLLPLALLTGCATGISSYPSANTSIGETKEWSMPLNREPGRVQLKMQVANKGFTTIALSSTKAVDEGPIHIIFSGSDCATGPDVYIKFFTSTTESYFKYFKSAFHWDKDLDISIDWDENAQTSISINSEKITVQPYKAFGNIRFSNKAGAMNIKELQYTPTNTAITQGAAQ